MLAMMTFMAVSILAKPVNLSVGFDDTTGTMPDYSKVPPAPVLEIDGNVLTFLTEHEDYRVSILDEGANEVFSVFVPSTLTTVTLPFEPGDNYLLRLFTGSYYYYYGSFSGPILLDGIYYYFYHTWKTATVTNDDNMYNVGDYYGTVNIPATVEYEGETYYVTAIGNYAFQYCSGLTSVTIPNGVISIGVGAFSECHKLTSINIPASVTSIGPGAFGDTGWFRNQPDGPVYLDNWLLGYKGSLTGELTIAEGIKAISNHAFFGCTGLTSVIIPNSLSIIENSAFNRCSGLTSVNIPSSVTTLGEGVFTDCSSLTSLHIPASVTNIPDGLCQDCSSLSSVTIEEGIASIGERAFYGCSSLASVAIPGSVKTIGTRDLYIRFDGWREFLKIEEMEGDDSPNGECATPTIIAVGNKFKFQCETPGAEFISSLSMEKNFTGAEVTMGNDEMTYILTVYATAPGYSQSKPATYRFTLNNSDVNRDGIVDVADITSVIATMAGQF